MPEFETLYSKLKRNFQINGKSESTFNNYARCLAHIALHYSCNPVELHEESVNDYLYYCQNLHKTPSESFFKHTIYGLRAAYKVYGKDALRIQLPQIRRQNKLPEILSRKEVKQLLNAPKYLKHKLVLAVLYGCGMRSYELCKLEIKHLDFDRDTIFIPKGKGNRDRYVPLSKLLKRGLKTYLETENPQQYVFNSQTTKEGKTMPYTTRGVQWAVKEAKSKTKIGKKVTAHVFRHTYATHLLEDGMDIVSLKELLGHSSVDITMTYLHVAKLEKKPKFSPLDTLFDQ